MEPALLQKLRDHCDMIGIAYERFARRAVSEAIAREPMLANGNVTFDTPVGGAVIRPAEKKQERQMLVRQEKKAVAEMKSLAIQNAKKKKAPATKKAKAK